MTADEAPSRWRSHRARIPAAAALSCGGSPAMYSSMVGMGASSYRPGMAVAVRYIVDDVDAGIAFSTGSLGFEVVMPPAPAFAILARGELRLLLSSPGGGPG